MTFFKGTWQQLSLKPPMLELLSLASTNPSLNRSLLWLWCTRRNTKLSPTCLWKGSWLVRMTALWKATLKRVSRWARIYWLLLCVTLLTRNLTWKAERRYACLVAFRDFCLCSPIYQPATTWICSRKPRVQLLDRRTVVGQCYDILHSTILTKVVYTQMVQKPVYLHFRQWF